MGRWHIHTAFNPTAGSCSQSAPWAPSPQQPNAVRWNPSCLDVLRAMAILVAPSSSSSCWWLWAETSSGWSLSSCTAAWAVCSTKPHAAQYTHITGLGLHPAASHTHLRQSVLQEKQSFQQNKLSFSPFAQQQRRSTCQQAVLSSHSSVWDLETSV